MKNYKSIWDRLSTNFRDASFYVCCIGDEDEIRGNGQHTAAFLRSVLQIQSTDRVLEIGCGVARIGRELAADCGEWWGVDISGNMIEYAMERTDGVPNVFLHELPSNDLAIFRDNSFDCVYCTIVFMHLDKPDMFTYICEALRVLKPGGRAYFDTYNITAPGAWEEFLKVVEAFPSDHRPGHVSQFSSMPEMRKFMEEAGYSAIHVDDGNEQLVVALGQKAPLAEDAAPAPASAESPLVSAPAPGIVARTEPGLLTETEQAVGSQSANGHGPAAGARRAAAYQRDEPADIEAYVLHLEREFARKNTAISALEARLRRRERELQAARRPRLPWKR